MYWPALIGIGRTPCCWFSPSTLKVSVNIPLRFTRVLTVMYFCVFVIFLSFTFLLADKFACCKVILMSPDGCENDQFDFDLKELT